MLRSHLLYVMGENDKNENRITLNGLNDLPSISLFVRTHKFSFVSFQNAKKF